jgi:hypothetical protein
MSNYWLKQEKKALSLKVVKIANNLFANILSGKRPEPIYLSPEALADIKIWGSIN